MWCKKDLERVKIMTELEKQQHNKKMFELAKKAGATVLEWDDYVIVDFGTDADYDTHAVDVQNNNGYYDENGRYVSYGGEL